MQVGEEELGPDAFPLDPTEADDLAAGDNFLVETELGRLDIMQWVPAFGDGPAFPALDTQAVSGDAFGIVVRVASLEHLRRMKRAAARPQDLQDLALLDEAHGGSSEG